MRFKYVRETKYSEENITNIMNKCISYVDILKNECSEFLKRTGNLKLMAYHVSNTKYNELTKITVRNNRQPRDSSVSQHKFYNLIIKRAGLVANRSNSIFVTGAGGTDTTEYGNEVTCFFPIGSFDFTWCFKHRDMTEAISISDYILQYKDINKSIQAENDFINNDMDEMLRDDSYMSPLLNADYFDELLDAYRGNDGSFMDALNSSHEIMIHPVGNHGYFLNSVCSYVVRELLQSGSELKAKGVLFRLI